MLEGFLERELYLYGIWALDPIPFIGFCVCFCLSVRLHSQFGIGRKDLR